MPDYYDYGIAVREPSWHRKEHLIDDFPRDWTHACQLAGMFEVELLPLREVEGWNKVVNTRTEKVITVVRDSYQLISVADMGRVIEDALENEPGWQIDTLFSLRNETMVAATIVLDEAIQIDGDPSKIFSLLTVSNGFGNSALTLSLSLIRACCANTVKASELAAEAMNVQWKIRHTSGWQESVQRMKDRFAFSRQVSSDFVATANVWIQAKVTDSEIERFFKDMAVAKQSKEKSRVRMVEQLEALQNAPTNLPVKGSVYGLWTTATEWADWVRPAHTNDTRSDRQLIRFDDVKYHTFQKCWDLAGGDVAAAKAGLSIRRPTTGVKDILDDLR